MTLNGQATVVLKLRDYCNSCDSAGRLYIDALDKDVACNKCQGKGYVLTSQGQEILELIRENLNKTKRKPRRR